MINLKERLFLKRQENNMAKSAIAHEKDETDFP